MFAEMLDNIRVGPGEVFGMARDTKGDCWSLPVSGDLACTKGLLALKVLLAPGEDPLALFGRCSVDAPPEEQPEGGCGGSGALWTLRKSSSHGLREILALLGHLSPVVAA